MELNQSKRFILNFSQSEIFFFKLNQSKCFIFKLSQSKNFIFTFQEIKKRFEKKLIKKPILKSIKGETVRKVMERTAQFGINNYLALKKDCTDHWNFHNAFFFAGTVATTIGYGADFRYKRIKDVS